MLEYITRAGPFSGHLVLRTETTGQLTLINVDRYLGRPGRSLAYKIGQLKISAIRSKTEKALGSKFDIRAFHDELLKDGPLPLDLLEGKMDAWITKELQ